MDNGCSLSATIAASRNRQLGGGWIKQLDSKKAPMEEMRAQRNFWAIYAALSVQHGTVRRVKYRSSLNRDSFQVQS